MTSDIRTAWNRRAFLVGSAAMIGAPAFAQDVDGPETVETERDVTTTVRRNISAFRKLD